MRSITIEDNIRSSSVCYPYLHPGHLATAQTLRRRTSQLGQFDNTLLIPCCPAINAERLCTADPTAYWRGLDCRLQRTWESTSSSYWKCREVNECGRAESPEQTCVAVPLHHWPHVSPGISKQRSTRSAVGYGRQRNMLAVRPVPMPSGNRTTTPTCLSSPYGQPTPAL